MGYGTALAEIPIGPSIIRESAQVTIMRATNHAGHLALLIYVNAPSPVSGQITFPGLVLPATAPYGGLLDMHIPLVTSLPGGPNVAVVQFRSTLGPLHLHYANTSTATPSNTNRKASHSQTNAHPAGSGSPPRSLSKTAPTRAHIPWCPALHGAGEVSGSRISPDLEPASLVNEYRQQA